MQKDVLIITDSCSIEYEDMSSEEWDTHYAPILTIEYTEHSSDHWHSDSETSVELTVDQAKEMVKMLKKFIDTHKKLVDHQEKTR